MQSKNCRRDAYDFCAFHDKRRQCGYIRTFDRGAPTCTRANFEVWPLTLPRIYVFRDSAGSAPVGVWSLVTGLSGFNNQSVEIDATPPLCPLRTHPRLDMPTVLSIVLPLFGLLFVRLLLGLRRASRDVGSV